MKIEAYKKAKHGDQIEEMLFEDVEGAGYIGEIGFASSSNDCSFWNYRIVIVEKGEVIGFANFGNVDSLNISVCLEQIYLRKDFRGKNIGEKLISSGLKYYKRLGVKILKFTVILSNSKAISFYEKCGFKRCGHSDYGIIHNGELVKVVYFAKSITG